MKILNPLGYAIDKGLDKLLTTKTGDYLCKKAVKFNDTKFMKNISDNCVRYEMQTGSSKELKKASMIAVGGIALASIILKDFITGLAYVYNDLSNKKIPKEQRPYNATWDLIYTIMNCTLVTAGTFLFTPALQKGFSKVTESFFEDPKTIERLAKATVEKTKGSITLNEATKIVSNRMKSIQNATSTGFSKFSALVIMGIGIKRVLAPFVSVPVTSAVKPYIEKGIQKSGNFKEEKVKSASK